eukprot:scaffold162787_cov15-Prasinocladus_malaysianus.AAC.1
MACEPWRPYRCDALEAFLEAARRDPTHADTHINIGAVLFGVYYATLKQHCDLWMDIMQAKMTACKRKEFRLVSPQPWLAAHRT